MTLVQGRKITEQTNSAANVRRALPAQERHIYAQTNIQFYNQLCEIGFGDGDLRKMRAAYELAAPLFASRFRPSGKPFINHLVGTASILTAYQAAAPVIVAGLLHAAYEQGDFLPFGERSTENCRRTVRQVVGDDVEALLARYAAFPWKVAKYHTIFERKPKFAAANRDILIIRVANALEDCLDNGLLYCSERRRKVGIGEVAKCIQLANALGMPGLAEELKIALVKTRDSDIPPTLAGRHNHSYSLHPNSGKSD